MMAIVFVVRVDAMGKEGGYFIGWEDLRLDQRRTGMSWRSELSLNWTTNRVIVVDKDGNGDSVSVQGAVDMVPVDNTERVKILILPGIYREKVLVPKSKPYISFIGNENQTSGTLITWNDKASDIDSAGYELGTYRSASVTVESDYFCAAGITFENTVLAVPGGYGMQAVALRLSGDKAVLYRIRVIGTQDTLLDECGTHYFYQCHIQGSIDFIFGRSRSLYDSCLLQSTATGAGAIAAHHRESPDENTGFSFVKCVVNGTGSIFLGRAWGNYSTIVYSHCYFDNIIIPVGWSDWDQPYKQKFQGIVFISSLKHRGRLMVENRTVVFGEYQCQGRGADMKGRVPWLKHFTDEEARPFLDRKFIQGENWLRL
ncbi:hypothetical protein SAY87_022133 [Trapa incisa]|uniref:Pectinesterase n=1 Tax=Trapa incisa TaxID=236973 RepID=A0AAN7PXE9_9MYRT|nr:hypothetical protein SAY87_022133 [Trapa incisa]